MMLSCESASNHSLQHICQMDVQLRSGMHVFVLQDISYSVSVECQVVLLTKAAASEAYFTFLNCILYMCSESPSLKTIPRTLNPARKFTATTMLFPFMLLSYSIPILLVLPPAGAIQC